MCDRPSDVSCDEPDATVRHLHCDLRQRIDRFKGTNVVPFRPRQMVEQQLRHDLANAFRSPAGPSIYRPDGKYDDEGDGK